MSYYLKSPGSLLDYSIDWAAGYLDSQTLTASSWSIVPAEPGGLVIAAESRTDVRATVTLGGGRPGQVYDVRNVATFSDGRTDERAIAVRVEQR